MLYRKLQASQVKCNFCLNWITLSSDIKHHINICDHCLQEGHINKSLKAVTSSGVFYAIQLVKQRHALQTVKQPNIFDINMDINKPSIDTKSVYEHLNLIQESNQERKTKNEQALKVQDILQQFLKQKQKLTKQQVSFLKNIISNKPVNHTKHNINFQSQIYCNKIQNQRIPLQFQIQQSQQKNVCSQQKNNLKNQPKNINSFKHNKFHQIKINSKNKQNQPLKRKTYTKNKQNIITSPKKRNLFNSPCKNSLKQRDMNLPYVNLTKQSGLKQISTPQKRFHTQFFNENNENQRLSLNHLYNSFQSFGNSRNSTCLSLKKSNCKSTSERFSHTEMKKFQETRNKISNYLQKNCESNSFGRLMFNAVYEAFLNTNVVGKTMELVSYNLIDTDFKCYLKSFDWQGIQVLKLVKTNLTDDNLKTLVDFIEENQLGIKVLVLTSNMLTQESIQYLYEKNLSNVKEIYLGKNRINKLKVKDTIKDLECRYSLYL